MEAIGIAIWELDLDMTLNIPLEEHWLSPKIYRVGFPLDYLLPYLLCYSLIHYFNISTKFKVFSIQWYQLYAYPG
jgi:hypothetical protein